MVRIVACASSRAAAAADPDFSAAAIWRLVEPTITTITTIIIMTTEYGTISYTQETPRWLWQRFTNGPGDQHDRYSERITGLIALDVLWDPGVDLPQSEQAQAKALVEEAFGVRFDSTQTSGVV